VFQRLVERDVTWPSPAACPTTPWLRGCAFAPNDFALVTAVGDALAKRQSIEVEELSDCTWLVREEGSGTRTLCQRYPHRQQAQAQPAHPRLQRRDPPGSALRPGDSADVTRGGGDGAAARAAGGASRAAPLPRRAWHVVYVSEGPVRPEVEAFVEFLQSNAARHVLARAREA